MGTIYIKSKLGITHFCRYPINQSIKIYLVTLEALQGDSKVAWANPKLPPKKTQTIIQLNKS